MTPHRVFLDDDNSTWMAWDVIPSWGERRQGERRSGTGSPPAGLNERRKAERRVKKGIRIGLTPRLSGGWLAFESGRVRRRLAPIPEGWHELSDAELRELLRSAEHISAKRRLIE